MSGYQDDFQSYSAGSGLPTGWTARWDGGTWSIIDESGDKILRQSDGGTGLRRLASLDALNLDAERQDIEFLALLRTSSIGGTAISVGLAGRATGTTSADGYVCGLSGDELNIRKYVAGTASSIAITTTLTLAVDTLYYVRFRINSTSLKARVWLSTDSEPGSWDLDTTDSSHSGDGWAGAFGLKGNNDTHDWAKIAFATAGDTAEFPTAATSYVARRYSFAHMLVR